MQELASPDGLAGDEAIAPAETPEISEDDALSQIYDKLTEEPQEDDEPVTDEAAEQQDDEAETTEPAAEEPSEPPPSFLPGAVKEKWASLDPDVREAIASSQGEMSRKLADITRQNQGIAPIRDELSNMAQEFPQLLNMKPQDVLNEMRQLATIGQQLEQNPVKTLLEVAKQRGVDGQLAQYFRGEGGQQAQQAPQQAQQHITQLQAEIRGLKQQLEQVGNPEYLQEQVSSLMQQQTAMGEVENFAKSAEHWDKAEPLLPKIIPIIRETKPGASNADILKASYEMAIQTLGLKAKAPAGDEPAAQPDPKKAEAALKAKSVNVQGSMSGKARQLTEDELLSKVFDQAMKR